ncbi:cupin domain-containing protein [Hyphobacterium sp.]|uniref:cupin domain-containing protein n=1 Tax=Hyphobacterium sp. TaxID=2004662 RepID=UPI003BAB64F7
MNRPIRNIADVDDYYPIKHGEKFEAQMGRMGPLVGLKQLGCSYMIVPPGKCAFPHHNHHVIEEAILILEGEGDYRFGDKTYPVKSGDLLGAPAGGRDVAHQLTNTGESDLRYVTFSTMQGADIVEYPDSNKVGAVTFDENGATFRHRAFAQEIDYYEGE